MTDFRALPNDHVLKPLELRMMEMCDGMGPLQHLGGNFVAALRVFADKHPTIHESADHDGVAGTVATWSAPERQVG